MFEQKDEAIAPGLTARPGVRLVGDLSRIDGDRK
jgi:hypothetical protein